MSRVDPPTPRRGRQTAVAWGVMLASLLVLAALFNAAATNALGGPPPQHPPRVACRRQWRRWPTVTTYARVFSPVSPRPTASRSRSMSTRTGGCHRTRGARMPDPEPSGRAGQHPLGAGVRVGRWLLPWISALLVAATLANAMNGAVLGSWQPMDGPSARFHTPVANGFAPAGTVGGVGDTRALDLACIARVAAYTASMSDAVRRCSTLAGAATTTTSGE